MATAVPSFGACAMDDHPDTHSRRPCTPFEHPNHGGDFFMPGDERPTTRIPVVEENARIEKRPVQSGNVRVRTRVEERPQVLREVLFGEGLEVVIVPTEREVEAPPPPRQEGEVTIGSLVEERLVVTRKLFVVEELHIRRSTRLDEVSVPVTLRAMRAVGEEDNTKDPNGPPSGPASGGP